MSNPPFLSSNHPPSAKQYGLSAHEQQAARLEKLLANPDKIISLPTQKHEKTLRPPREIMKNVSGSSAGAGSGEFHVYKHSRRREYERIKLMEEAAEKERQEEEYKNRQKDLQLSMEKKTNKNRAKREKRKAAKGKAKSENQTNISNDAEDAINEIDENNKDSTNEKRRRLNAEGASEVIFQPPESDLKG